jgi:hypothetical protein
MAACREHPCRRLAARGVPRIEDRDRLVVEHLVLATGSAFVAERSAGERAASSSAP